MLLLQSPRPKRVQVWWLAHHIALQLMLAAIDDFFTGYFDARVFWCVREKVFLHRKATFVAIFCGQKF